MNRPDLDAIEKYVIEQKHSNTLLFVGRGFETLIAYVRELEQMLAIGTNAGYENVAWAYKLRIKELEDALRPFSATSDTDIYREENRRAFRILNKELNS